MNEPGYLFDTNVWIALVFASHPLHALANQALLAATPRRQAYFCCSTQQSFLRLLSSENIASQYGILPIPNNKAFEFLETLSERANVGFREEPSNLMPRWKLYGGLATSSPKRWMDAYLAAFAAESDLELVSGDKAFQTFGDLMLKPLFLS